MINLWIIGLHKTQRFDKAEGNNVSLLGHIIRTLLTFERPYPDGPGKRGHGDGPGRDHLGGTVTGDLASRSHHYAHRMQHLRHRDSESRATRPAPLRTVTKPGARVTGTSCQQPG